MHHMLRVLTALFREVQRVTKLCLFIAATSLKRENILYCSAIRVHVCFIPHFGFI